MSVALAVFLDPPRPLRLVDDLPNYELLEPHELVYGMARREVAAFDEFHARTRTRLLHMITSQLVDLDQSREVLQEVFMEIWLTADRFVAARGSAITWATTIARRRAIDRIRASQASRVRDLRIGIRDFVRSVDDVATVVEVRSEAARARAAMEVLTDAQREAIELVYDGGLSQAEAALLAGVRVSTIKTRVRDGLSRLRVEMQRVEGVS